MAHSKKKRSRDGQETIRGGVNCEGTQLELRSLEYGKEQLQLNAR